MMMTMIISLTVEILNVYITPKVFIYLSVGGFDSKLREGYVKNEIITLDDFL